MGKHLFYKTQTLYSPLNVQITIVISIEGGGGGYPFDNALSPTLPTEQWRTPLRRYATCTNLTTEGQCRAMKWGNECVTFIDNEGDKQSEVNLDEEDTKGRLGFVAGSDKNIWFYTQYEM